MLNNDLKHEFPALEDKMNEMKAVNLHFKKLFDEYHEANNEIKKHELTDDAISDAALTELRKRRLHLKDELYQMLVNN